MRNSFDASRRRDGGNGGLGPRHKNGGQSPPCGVTGRCIASVLVTLITLAGCQAPPTDRELAYQAWDQQRAALKHELASSELREGRAEAAATLAREAVALSPQNPAHAELLAEACLARGDFAAARNVLTTACRVNPDAAQAAYMLGTLDERERNWPLAVEHFATAAAARPEVLEYQLALAQARAQAEGVGPARDGLLRCYDRFGSEPLYHVGCAELARLEGDLPSACVAYETAQRLGCDDPTMQQSLGLCYYWLGRHAAAVDQLQALVSKTQPPEPAAMIAYAGALLALGRTASAADWLTRFVTQRPDHEQLWLLLAQARARGGDQHGAGQAVREAQRLAPRSARVARMAAAVLLSAQQWEAARNAAHAAVALDDENADAHLLLGRASERLGECDVALAAYEQALELEPLSSAAAALLAGVDR
ncbi:tetratricopeptide repeat protein [Phycisphaerae bacterium RAS1]|nr:tetratricopeptide repeat protein [Phycisphaerae bacterium RAS1]